MKSNMTQLRNLVLICLVGCFFQFCNTKKERGKNNGKNNLDQLPTKQEQVEQRTDTVLPKDIQITAPKFPIQNFYGTWARDSVNLDFRVDSLSFFIIARNIHLPYSIRYDTLLVFETYNEIIPGILKKVTEDSLVIFWYETNEYDRYIKAKE